MDGNSRFAKIHLLKSKVSDGVNNHLKEYIIWAERQAGRMVYTKKHSVKQVLTDKGGEFINDAMEAWYNSRGIEHIQLNLCERTHQLLVAMTKATMQQAGFPRSL
ncbi:Integrase catalytic core protein [Phytophthora palmivora]|uniref:Integrase catalytic core protein n=1 Tax=Phytophthora palmivora TaxID=4796 RepID=A0A2P4Y9D1_9STRA|nr:Integrase catalytic core protein [Phytophthora palmivora]